MIKKKIWCILLLLLMFVSVDSVSAADTIHDDAGEITDEQEAELQKELDAINSNFGIKVTLVSSSDADVAVVDGKANDAMKKLADKYWTSGILHIIQTKNQTIFTKYLSSGDANKFYKKNSNSLKNSSDDFKNSGSLYAYWKGIINAYWSLLSCDDITSESVCNGNEFCNWKYGRCYEGNTGGNGHGTGKQENFENGSSLVSCGNGLLTDIPKAVPSIVHIVYMIIQIAIPVVLVIMGMIDLLKSVSAGKEDEIAKSRNMFIKRLIMAVLVFFVFYVVKLLISVVADNSNIMDCAECLINNNC